jgi:hypothetical protein
MRAPQNASVQFHDGCMQELFGTSVTQHPRLATVQHFAQDQSIEQLRPFQQWDVWIMVKDFPMGIECGMCQGDSAFHFNPMISFVMQDPS